jgi:hypothetical protein
MTFRAANFWTYPTGSVWIQHFELELTNGVPESRRRLETRLLVRDTTSSGVYGVTYRWHDDPTNATLVADTGLDESFAINDGGMVRTQVWHYPGRNECLVCHTPVSRGVLGFTTHQLNRDFDYGGIVDNQLRALNNVRYFTTTLTNLHPLRSLPALDDESWSVEARARAYLVANCSPCHLPGGTGQAQFDTRIWTPLSQANLINGPLNNTFGDPDNRVVVPGSLSRSMLLTRLSTRGPGQMPPVGTALADTQAVALLSRWITNDLPGYQTMAAWQMAHFGSTNAPDALPTADPDMDRASNLLEWLTGTSPTNALEAWGISAERSSDTVEIVYPRVANRGFEVQWTAALTTNTSWNVLDVPQNRPFLSASNDTVRVPDAATNGGVRVYRVRVFEP